MFNYVCVFLCSRDIFWGFDVLVSAYLATCTAMRKQPDLSLADPTVPAPPTVTESDHIAIYQKTRGGLVAATVSFLLSPAVPAFLDTFHILQKENFLRKAGS